MRWLVYFRGHLSIPDWLGATDRKTAIKEAKKVLKTMMKTNEFLCFFEVEEVE